MNKHMVNQTDTAYTKLTETIDVYKDIEIIQENFTSSKGSCIQIVTSLTELSINTCMQRLLSPKDSLIVTNSIMPSVESFYTFETRAQANSIVQEGFSNLLLKLWNSIKAFFVSLYKNATVLFKNVTRQRLSHGERMIFLKHKIAEIKALKLKVPSNAGYLQNKAFLDFFSISGKFSPTNIVTIIQNQKKLLSSLVAVNDVTADLEQYRRTLLAAVEKEISNKNEWINTDVADEHTNNSSLKNVIKNFFITVVTDPYSNMNDNILKHTKKLFFLKEVKEELEGKNVVAKTPSNFSLACGFQIFLINDGDEENTTYQLKNNTIIETIDGDVEVEIVNNLSVVEEIYNAVLEMQKIDTSRIEATVSKSEVMLNKFTNDTESKFKGYFDAINNATKEEAESLASGLNSGVRKVVLNVIKTYSDIMKKGVMDGVHLSIQAEKIAISYLDSCVREFKQN